MRYNIVKSLVQKEIKYIFRDKKTIFMMIILPILLYPVLMIGSMSIGTIIGMGDDERVYQVGLSNEVSDKLLEMIDEEEQLEFVTVVDYEEAINNKEIQIYVEVTADDTYAVYYNGSQNDSSSAEEIINEILEDYKNFLIEGRIIAEGFEADTFLTPIKYTSENIAAEEEMAGFMLASILPFILLLIISQSALYPSIDVMAGEKERGTLETLLTLPITNLELVTGKYIAVSIVALMTTFLHILSLIGSVLLIVVGVQAIGDNDLEMGINIGEFILPIVLGIIAILAFTLVVAAVSMSICSFAKSFKEAQNYLTPLQLLVMLPSYVVLVPTLELNGMTALIPVVNTALLIKSVFLFEIQVDLILSVLGINIVLVILAIFVLIRLFNSEEILFGSGKEFSLLQKRYNIKKGTMPTAGDAYFIFALAFLMLIYVGQILQVQFGFIGIALSQLTLVAIPLAGAWYIKTDWKKAFSIKKPTIRQVVASIILWIGAYLMINVITYLLLPLSNQNLEAVEELSLKLFHENILLNLLVVAVFPAICEELLFRGMIYKGIEEGNKSKRALIVSSILFGLMHLDLIRIIPTGLVGLLAGYIVYKSGSIFLAMLVHFINNGVIVLISQYSDVLEDSFLNIEMPPELTFLLGGVIVGIGMLCMGKTKKEEVIAHPIE